MVYLRDICSLAALLLGVTAFQADGVAAQNHRSVDINEQGPNNQHMIFRRIEEGDYTSVAAFLDAGVDPDVKGFMGMTPAIWAASSDSWEMVHLLASRGAELGIVARNGASVAEILERVDRLNRVREGTPNWKALERVRAILTARGLL